MNFIIIWSPDPFQSHQRDNCCFWLFKYIVFPCFTYLDLDHAFCSNFACFGLHLEMVNFFESCQLSAFNTLTLYLQPHDTYLMQRLVRRLSERHSRDDSSLTSSQSNPSFLRTFSFRKRSRSKSSKSQSFSDNSFVDHPGTPSPSLLSSETDSHTSVRRPPGLPPGKSASALRNKVQNKTNSPNRLKSGNPNNFDFIKSNTSSSNESSRHNSVKYIEATDASTEPKSKSYNSLPRTGSASHIPRTSSATDRRSSYHRLSMGDDCIDVLARDRGLQDAIDGEFKSSIVIESKKLSECVDPIIAAQVRWRA